MFDLPATPAQPESTSHIRVPITQEPLKPVMYSFQQSGQLNGPFQERQRWIDGPHQPYQWTMPPQMLPRKSEQFNFADDLPIGIFSFGQML